MSRYAKAIAGYGVSRKHIANPTRLSARAPYFACVYPAVNRGQPSLNLVGSQGVVVAENCEEQPNFSRDSTNTYVIGVCKTSLGCCHLDDAICGYILSEFLARFFAPCIRRRCSRRCKRRSRQQRPVNTQTGLLVIVSSAGGDPLQAHNRHIRGISPLFFRGRFTVRARRPRLRKKHCLPSSGHDPLLRKPLVDKPRSAEPRGWKIRHSRYQ